MDYYFISHPCFWINWKLNFVYTSRNISVFVRSSDVVFAVLLYKKQSIKAARQLMLVSVSYITLLQIIFVVDKFYWIGMDLTQGTLKEKNNRAKKMMLWFNYYIINHVFCWSDKCCIG